MPLSISHKLLIAAWGVFALIGSMFLSLIVDTGAETTLHTCDMQQIFWSYDKFGCSSWPDFLRGYLFIVMSFLAGPKRLAYYFFAAIAVTYLNAAELINYGEIAIANLPAVIEATIWHPDVAIGAIAAAASLFIGLGLFRRRTSESGT